MTMPYGCPPAFETARTATANAPTPLMGLSAILLTIPLIRYPSGVGSLMKTFCPTL